MSSSKRFLNCRGSFLITAAIAASVLAIVIVTILQYLSNEYYLNVRSHRWAQSLSLGEAGVEIGFAEFNNYYTQGTGFQSARGWTTIAGGYSMTVSNFTDNSGKVIGNIQVTVYGPGTSTPWILGVGTCPTLPFGPTVSRGVKAILTGSSQYPAAMIAKSTITMSGSASIDSFDSTDPTKSTSGQYDVTKRQANGNIATYSSVANADTMSGSVAVYGTVATGPGGTVAMSGSSSVGPTTVTASRATTVAQGVADGYIRSDFQATIPDITLPSNLASTSSSGSISYSGSNVGTISSGSKQYSAINMSGSTTLFISGAVNLYIPGAVSVSGSAIIKLLPGASLTVYSGGTVNVSGSGVLNQPGTAVSLQWYGLPTCSSFSYSGSSGWIGVVNTPEANISMSGSSGQSGSLIGNKITYSGSVGFHYDESLAKLNGGGTYILNSWQEMKPNGSGGWVIW